MSVLFGRSFKTAIFSRTLKAGNSNVKFYEQIL